MLLWLGTYKYVTGWLAIYLSVFACLVVGFRPRFHSGHLAPPEVSCLKRKTTLQWPQWIFALIQWPPGNVQRRFKRPLNFSASITHVHCILVSSRKTSIQTESLQIVKFLKFQVGIISLDSQDPRILEMCKKCRRPCHWMIYQELCRLIVRAVQSLLCWIM